MSFQLFRSSRLRAMAVAGAFLSVLPLVSAPCALAQTLAKTSAASSGAPLKNDVLVKMQRGELTLSDVIDGIGSPQSATRRQTALAVLALREHYIAGARVVAERRYAGKAGPLAAVNALQTLAWLRATDPAILRDAARHIGFNWTPPVSRGLFSLHRTRSVSRRACALGMCALGMPSRATFPAARLLVQAGFAALPALSEVIAVAPLPVAGQTPRDKSIALACAYLILGPATVSWLQEQSQIGTDAAQRDTLQAAARFLAAQPPSPGSEEAAHESPEWLRDLQLEKGPDDGFSYSDLKPALLKSYKIRWDAALALGDEKTQVKDRAMPQMDNSPLAASTVARTEIERATRLLAINIIERLPAYIQKSSNDPLPFATEAQADAIRLIGAFRVMPQAAAWSLWDGLLKLSFSGDIDKKASEVAPALRALGQLGTPAATLLLGRMAHVSGSGSLRAATYELGHVLGRYSRDYLNNEIAALKRKREAKGKPFETDSYENAYMTALQLGEANKWFEGPYYGSADPQAYAMLPPTQNP